MKGGTDAQAQPEGAERGECRSCHRPIWWVVTTTGQQMPLDETSFPDGNIEMVHIAGEWRAEVLAQIEALFEIERPHWRPHFASCPDAAKWRRPGIPRQRQP